MTNQPLGDFPRRLLLDLAFEEGFGGDIADIHVQMPEANDGEPVDAGHVFGTTWQAVLGFEARRDLIGSLQITVVDVDTPDGVVWNFLPAVLESIGTIPRRFGPGDSVGDLCGGFEPF